MRRGLPALHAVISQGSSGVDQASNRFEFGDASGEHAMELIERWGARRRIAFDLLAHVSQRTEQIMIGLNAHAVPWMGGWP